MCSSRSISPYGVMHFFAARGLTAGCLSAGMLAAVQTHPANSVFIVIVRLGNCFPAAIPVLLVAERCLLVIRWRRCMIIRSFLAAILLANRTVSGFTTVCFPPGSIISLRGNYRAVVYNSAAVRQTVSPVQPSTVSLEAEIPLRFV